MYLKRKSIKFTQIPRTCPRGSELLKQKDESFRFHIHGKRGIWGSISGWRMRRSIYLGPNYHPSVSARRDDPIESFNQYTSI